MARHAQVEVSKGKVGLGVGLIALSAVAVPVVGFAVQETAGRECPVEIHDQSGNLPDGSTLCQVASGKTCTFNLELCRSQPGCAPARGTKARATGHCNPGKLKITKAQSQCGPFVGIKVRTRNKGKERGACTIRVGAKSAPKGVDVTLVCLPAGSAPGVCPIHTVFLILMENSDWSSIKNSSSAPYINHTLLPIASHAEQYYNPPGLHPSLPNYLWLEAGTNFGILDDDYPAHNHQSTTSHLDDLTQTNDSTARRCIQHVRPYSELETDLINDTVARYNFITPNLCNDMHDACAPLNDPVQQGDTWLSTEVPKILTSPAYANNGVLFILWDEGGTGDGPIGMIVLSPKAKGGEYSNPIVYHHSSTLRTMQEIFNVTTPMLGGAADATNAFDLRDLFVSFP